jgi:hypothetical protein
MTTRGVIAGGALVIVGCQALLSDTPPKERVVVVVQGPDASDAATALDGLSGDELRPSAYAQEVLADYPVAYFRLGEANGSRAVVSLVRDLTGLVGNGVTLGTSGALAGDLDTAAAFDGKTQITVTGNPFAFAERHAFSIELWVRPQAANALEHLFSSEYDDVSGARTGYNVLRIGGVTRFERFSSGDAVQVDGPDLKPNEWSYLLATYDGNALKLMVRSASLNEEMPVSDVRVVPIYGAEAYVGMKRDDSAHFAGVIDELAIYDHALPPDRSARHYAVGTGEL